MIYEQPDWLEDTDDGDVQVARTWALTPEDIVRGLVEARINTKADIDALSAHISALNERLMRMREKERRITDRIKVEMALGGIHKLKDPRFTVYTQRRAGGLLVQDESALPDAFWRVVPEQRQIDRNGLAAHYRATGEVPDGCEVGDDTTSVIVRVGK